MAYTCTTECCAECIRQLKAQREEGLMLDVRERFEQLASEEFLYGELEKAEVWKDALRELAAWPGPAAPYGPCQKTGLRPGAGDPQSLVQQVIALKEKDLNISDWDVGYSPPLKDGGNDNRHEVDDAAEYDEDDDQRCECCANCTK